MADDSIMAHMLAGQWYARACGLLPVVSPDVLFSRDPGSSRNSGTLDVLFIGVFVKFICLKTDIKLVTELHQI